MKNKNRHGWVKIVESFTSIMLIAVAMIIVIGNQRSEIGDSSSQIYDAEYGILREIELNNELRNEILNIPNTDFPDFPVNVTTANLDNLNGTIAARTPTNLNCRAKLCQINGPCVFDNGETGKSIYAKSVMISANLTSYNPKRLSIFCWEK